MAAPLRHPLILLACAAMLAIYLPLAPALAMLLTPALYGDNWRALFADAQFWQSLTATLVSTTLAVVGALAIALSSVAALWPGASWQRLSARLPLLLAIPHVAFATAVLLLFADGGVVYRLLPFVSAPYDRYGIGLGITLAVKESAFLLWVIYGVLRSQTLSQQATVLQSLGYGRGQTLWWLIVPAIAPTLAAVSLAIAAWSVSVVDVAIILGPGNPPTLAVLSWQWLNQGDALQQAKGLLACLLLSGLLGLYAGVGYAMWRVWRRVVPTFSGVRRPSQIRWPGVSLAVLLPLCGVLCSLLLVVIAADASLRPDLLSTSLTLALGSSGVALVVSLLWLEAGLLRFSRWIWLPIALPALPLAVGQYRVALMLGIDGEYGAILWGHLLWVVPWMLLVLQPAWQRLDARQMLVARTLGWSRIRIFYRLKLPLLIRPGLAALAVGFSVSIAQYMPTLWLGAGRFATFTTEAVALSSGGGSSALAGQALWQLLLPALFFALTAYGSRRAGDYRQGLR